jgi:hypothetical protein
VEESRVKESQGKESSVEISRVEGSREAEEEDDKAGQGMVTRRMRRGQDLIQKGKRPPPHPAVWPSLQLIRSNNYG